ncbi:hypothetical protein ACKTEK_00265 [Tepidamorphus sp. 3E244]|uniref:hypothetical protein n=1 Tax=Tepidamorphus sp. 3E244 TaxID=3385498 RepID=UPI0038FC9C10
MRTSAITTLVAAAAGFVLTIGAALANPEGTYRVEGTNPDDGNEYAGTVEVTRTGNTYKIVWDVGRTRYEGTGVGAVFEDGALLVGEAQDNDVVLSVAYVAGNTYGTTIYVLQPNGTWVGSWTYGGGEDIGYETWTRN